MLVAMLLAGCTPTTTTPPTTQPTQQTPANTPKPAPATITVTPTPAAAADKSYNYLNPMGSFIPVQTKALAPRLDKIEGKTIYVVQGEADAVIFPALIERLKKDYPKTNWVFYQTSASFGINAVDDTMKKDCQAAIRGNGW